LLSLCTAFHLLRYAASAHSAPVMPASLHFLRHRRHSIFLAQPARRAAAAWLPGETLQHRGVGGSVRRGREEEEKKKKKKKWRRNKHTMKAAWQKKKKYPFTFKTLRAYLYTASFVLLPFPAYRCPAARRCTFGACYPMHIPFRRSFAHWLTPRFGGHALTTPYARWNAHGGVPSAARVTSPIIVCLHHAGWPTDVPP